HDEMALGYERILVLLNAPHVMAGRAVSRNRGPARPAAQDGTSHIAEAGEHERISLLFGACHGDRCAARRAQHSMYVREDLRRSRTAAATKFGESGSRSLGSRLAVTEAVDDDVGSFSDVAGGGPRIAIHLLARFRKGHGSKGREFVRFPIRKSPGFRSDVNRRAGVRKREDVEHM